MGHDMLSSPAPSSPPPPPHTHSILQDPYILRTHLGTLECRLCLTLHTNEGSYLAHTQGKKHQTNLARRAARDVKEGQLMITMPKSNEVMKKNFVKIGRPGKYAVAEMDLGGRMESSMNELEREGSRADLCLPTRPNPPRISFSPLSSSPDPYTPSSLASQVTR